MSNLSRGLGLLAAVAVLLAAVSVPVVGAITVGTDATYQGTEGDSQAVAVSVTISPESSPMTDVVVDVRPTDRSFVAYDSFDRTITPGSANVNVTYVGQGRFEVTQLSPDQELTITYDAYPRTIKSQSLDVSTVSVSYVQNGQTLDRQETVSADLSSSSWFALQTAQRNATAYQGVAAVGGLVVVAAALGGAYVGWKRMTDTGDDDEFGSDSDSEF